MRNDFDANETFHVVPHDPGWAQKFEEECEHITEVMGDDVIEIVHVGSTSVPGLSAKPIIDLLMVVEGFAPIPEYERRLESLGYHCHHHADEGDRIFFWKGKPRTHHLHIVEYATWEHQRHIIFRDYLRRHPEVAQEYEKVKRELMSLFKSDRPAYTRGKTAFITNIMARAVEEILDPSLRRLVDAAVVQAPNPDGQHDPDAKTPPPDSAPDSELDAPADESS